MTLSNITLVKIGAVGGLATITMGLLLRNKIIFNIRQTDYYKDALKSVRQHNGATYLLGEPIKDRSIDVSDVETNFTKANYAQYKVPLKGSKKSGYLYFWAERNTEEEKWNVVRMELELADDSSKRLLIKSLSRDKTS